MGFKVNYRGLEVTCETPEDVDALADRARSKGAQKEAIQRFPRLPLLERHGDVKRLVGELGQQQKTLLRQLVDRGKLSDADIRQLLSLGNNKALAGVLTGISKRAKRAGISGTVLEKTSKRNGTGERHYQYTISSRFFEDVKEGLHM